MTSGIFEIDYVARIRGPGYFGLANPQLALWATNMALASPTVKSAHSTLDFVLDWQGRDARELLSGFWQ